MSPRDEETKNQQLLEVDASPEMLQKLCFHCFHVLVKELMPQTSSSSTMNTRRLASSSLHHGGDDDTALLFPNAKCPIFVTWDKRIPTLCDSSEFRLRGCIGTLSPRPLHTSITEYALTSALRDRRFDPIRLHEVPYLRVAVSLLIKYEKCLHCHDWSVGVHGIIIRFVVDGTEFSATYLPEVAREQGWTQQQAVQSLVKKAGFHGKKVIPHTSIHCTRYQSSKHHATYQDYVNTIGKDPLGGHDDDHNKGSCVSM